MFWGYWCCLDANCRKIWHSSVSRVQIVFHDIVPEVSTFCCGKDIYKSLVATEHGWESNPLPYNYCCRIRMLSRQYLTLQSDQILLRNKYKLAAILHLAAEPSKLLGGWVSLAALFSALGISSVVDCYRCGGLGLKSRVGQIEHSIANGSSPLRRFFGAVLPRG